MAIVQISRITNRKGLQENLPQLAGAELGWSIDSRRLFIGNGTLEEGAPVIGNTEILTEFSDIFAFQSSYTYKGEAAGYTVQTSPSGTPVTQSLQSWLDQFATVKDFGAVGDGVTDDTEAINWALFQLFCRAENPEIRRSLFFPAGVYRVTDSINIPPYATLYGEGLDNTIIRIDQTDDSSLSECVARTADSLQQTGVNIGNGGATPPQFITISNMSFENADATLDVIEAKDIFLVQDAVNCRFNNVGFIGSFSASYIQNNTGLVTTADVAAVRFSSTPSVVCDQIVFDGCRFFGLTYGINTDEQTKGVTVTNSKFDTLYQGVVLGEGTVVNGGPTGTRIMGNLFDNIYAEGIIFDDVSLNASGHNIFYDVGNDLLGVTNPATPIIDIRNNDNVSLGDMFERPDNYSAVYPRVDLNNTRSIGIINGKQLELGTITHESGLSATLLDNVSLATTIFGRAKGSIIMDYTIVRGTATRTGRMTIANDTTPVWTDDFVENSSTGITLSVIDGGGIIQVQYTSTSLSLTGTFYYAVTYLPSVV